MAAFNKNVYLNLKKIIKEEPEATQRLQALKISRDLSLGGSRQPKKLFAPNLKAVRNKDKAKDLVQKNECSTKERPKQKIANKTNKNNSSRFVQSSGIFSEGIGSDLVHSNRWRSGTHGGSDDRPAAYLTAPTLYKNSFDVNKDEEDNIFAKITNCDDESDDDDMPLMPIYLQNNIQKPSKLPNDIINNRIKCEPREFIEGRNFSNESPSFSLWTLPNSFAGKGLSDDPNCKKLFDYRLNDMHEGQVGKILIRKSGRIDVQINNIIYTLEPEELWTHKEEIVSLQSKNSDEKIDGISANVLGRIKHRYNLTPDWKKLLWNRS